MTLKFWKRGSNAQGRSKAALALLEFEPDKPIEEIHLWELGGMLRNAAWHCERPGDRAAEVISIVLDELSRRDNEVWHRYQLVKELEWKAKHSEIMREYR